MERGGAVHEDRAGLSVASHAPDGIGDGEDVRLIVPDLIGMARGKYIALADLTKEVRVAAAMYLIGHDVEPQILPGLSADVGYPDVILRAEPESLRPGWIADERLAFAGAYLGDGGPFPLDPRHRLRRIVAQWEEEFSLAPQVAMELEFFVLEPDGEGGWRAATIPSARPYGTGSDVDPCGVIRQIRAAARRAGIPIEGISTEFFPGQFEVNLAPRDALRACDEIFLFRLLVREAVDAMGLKATFLPRPFNDRGGNGLHVNLSFRDGADENALHAPDQPDGLSPHALSIIGGLIEHHVSMTALLAPTVNSYKRLRPDLMCGYYADWGHDHRFVTVRVPAARGEATRIEARQADASGSPHLTVVTLLGAALDGMRSGAVPPPPRVGADPVPGAATVPGSLGEALDALEREESLRRILGPEMIDAFLAVKRHEWRRFCEHVTDWELDEYLPHH